jgi:hypothetical protein
MKMDEEILDKIKIRLEIAKDDVATRERWVSEARVKMNTIIEIISDLEGEK